MIRPTADSCPSEAALEAHAAGPEEPSLREHVDGCIHCRQVVSDIRQNDELLRQMIPGPRRTRAVELPIGSKAGALPEIPGYRVVAAIGHGSQGMVYKAVQLATNRDVAIKILHGSAWASPSQRRRFERELELAAGLRHPNIVTLHEGGETTVRDRYIVMEYVEGEPLDQYLRSRSIEASRIESLLQLFAIVCDAVNHAHQRGVIHRDLKPANILVDRAGQPRVLDFGLAKLEPRHELSAEMAGPSQVTMAGAFMGTPAYAAPEQVLGLPDAVDIRTDVYALGVILYEMVTGRLPRSSDGDMFDILRRVRHEDPPPPSNYSRGLPRDVEAIVLKALARDKDRRYQSAGALLADIQHYLAGEPIEARRDSMAYVVLKLARRQKLPLAICAAFVALAGGFLFKSAHDATEIRRQKEAAHATRARFQAESERAEALSLVLQAAGRLTQRIDVSDDPAALALSRLHEQIRLGWMAANPKRESAMSLLLAGVFRDGGITPTAEELLRQAAEHRMLELGLDDPETAHAMYELAHVLLVRRRYMEAERCARRACETDTKAYGDTSLEAARDKEILGRVFIAMGKAGDAYRLAAQAVAAQTAHLGEENVALAQSLFTRSAALFALDDVDAAEIDALRSLRLRLILLQDDHPAVLDSLGQMAAILQRRSDMKRPGVPNADMHALARAVGADTREVAARRLLDLVRDLERTWSPASTNVIPRRAVLRQMLSVKEALLGPLNKGLLSTLADLTRDSANRCAWLEEEAILGRVLQIIESTQGPQSIAAANCLEERATALSILGCYADEITQQERSVDIWWSLPSDRRDDFQAAANERFLAQNLVLERRYEQAERRYSHCIDSIWRVVGPDNHVVAQARAGRALAWLHLGRADDAEREAREALALGERLEKTSGTVGTDVERYFLGRILTARGRFDGARPYLDAAWKCKCELDPCDRMRQSIVADMISLCAASGDLEGQSLWAKELP